MPSKVFTTLKLMNYRLNQPEVKIDPEVKVLDQPQQAEEPRMRPRQLHSRVDPMQQTTFSVANSQKARTTTVELTGVSMVPPADTTAQRVAILIDRRFVGSAVFHLSRPLCP